MKKMTITFEYYDTSYEIKSIKEFIFVYEKFLKDIGAEWHEVNGTKVCVIDWDMNKVSFYKIDCYNGKSVVLIPIKQNGD